MPLVENDTVVGVVNENKLLYALVDKKLKGTDLAKKAIFKEFVIVDHGATGD